MHGAPSVAKGEPPCLLGCIPLAGCAHCGEEHKEASECALVGLSVLDGCAASCSAFNGDWCHVEFLVHKVVVERRLKAAPVLRWLLGHREELYVEVIPTCGVLPAKRTASGVIVSGEESSGIGRLEVWAWPASGRPPDTLGSGSSDELDEGGRVSMDLPLSSELSMRVVGTHLGGTLMGEAPEVLGELRFRMDDDLRSGTLPLVSDSRICGSIVISVAVHESKVPLHERSLQHPPATTLGGRLVAAPEWGREDLRDFA